MLRKTLILGAGAAFLSLGLAMPAFAGGVAGKSYLVKIIWQGLGENEACLTFDGQSSDDAGDLLVNDNEVGRWRHLGKTNGQTLFKIRMDTDSSPLSFRLQGLREKAGPGESIGLAGYATDGEGYSNLSIAGYRVPSCEAPSGPEVVVLRHL